jgi:hypothetical protein
VSAFDPLRTLGAYEIPHRMRIASLIVVLGLAACAVTPRDRRDQIMDAVESQVRLPSGASPLAAYARYYAWNESGEVWAVYTIPGPPPSGQEICKVMDGRVPPEKWRTVPCEKESPEQSYLPAGQRRWMSSPLAIPTTLDTLGCEQITFTYNQRGNAFRTPPSCSNEYQRSATGSS